MRVLGIDCGTERTGWGVIESDGRRHAVIAHGVISLSPKDALCERLAAVGLKSPNWILGPVHSGCGTQDGQACALD